MQQIIDAYKRSSKRILLLDYDGTLREFTATPAESIPTKELLETLRSLGNDAKNEVVIISGREQESLNRWFGDLPVSLSAEHGLFVKGKGSAWKPLNSLDLTWKDTARATIQQYVAQVPGTFIEEKVASLAWHYRTADDKSATTIIPSLEAQLALIATAYNLRVRHASKVIEISAKGINKGIAVNHFLAQNKYDFILAMGDEETDEDMFRNLSDSAFTVKVREGPTIAKARLDNPAAVRAFLQMLTQA